MEFTVQLLGTNSALPIHGRFPTSQYLKVKNNHFLIDCGEGTQIQLGKYKVKRNKIDTIFVSHLHGDHVYGLPGLLGSYNHFNRSYPLKIYGPPGLKDFIYTAIRISGAKFLYELNITEIPAESEGCVYIDNEVSVRYFPLKHRVTNFGYRFDFKPLMKNLKKEAIEKYQLTIPMIRQAKAGNDVVLNNGEKISNDLLTLKSVGMASYGYCSDTIYDEDLLKYIAGVDLLYHETTYLDGMEEEARIRMHSTLGQAITIAELAKVKKLLTGHYSSRYSNLEDFQKVADKTQLPISIGKEGEIYIII